MRYAITRYNQHQRDLAYRIYVSDCLRIITKNTASLSKGEYIDRRYIDAILPKKKDDRTAEEIVIDIIKKAGIEVI